MSAAANAAAFLSMRRRLFPEQGAVLHPPVHHEPPRPRPVRVAAVDPQVRISYRKRRWSPE